ncbi:DUF1501 domain-containing protein [Pseudocolwellia agarivorans]|uniref:DUF1501 domain-containing protein n=1 Tax=Pseudocolwellia agarivorans TaxID=1911682 RepID=UPI0009858C96|nr:DUF1501 domain-containing protein [Pseudocolwellia agarivorans]
MKRRHFIKTIGASLVLFQGTALASKAKALKGSQANTKKIVWVVLRGGLDSLHTIVPTFEADLVKLRPSLYKSVKDKLLPLDNGFAFNPALKHLHTWYKNKELIPVVAVGSGYKRRSHFDGQDFLESGLTKINEDSGWLARALKHKNKKALAVSRSTPVSLRGSDNTSTWYPSSLKDADDDVYAALGKLYAEDALLSSRLKEGLNIQDMAGSAVSEKRKGKFIDLTKACAQLLKNNNTIDCAMLELGGWDTHNNQDVRLKKQLTELDNGLESLKEGLGETWKDTIVIVATEFGRTAKENGTGGTDHGTASNMFIAGGSVKGGKVLGDWPGLSESQLFEQRDLMPTSNSFSWIASVLGEQWGLSADQLNDVFPAEFIKRKPTIKIVV